MSLFNHHVLTVVFTKINSGFIRDLIVPNWETFTDFYLLKKTFLDHQMTTFYNLLNAGNIELIRREILSEKSAKREIKIREIILDLVSVQMRIPNYSHSWR